MTSKSLGLKGIAVMPPMAIVAATVSGSKIPSHRSTGGKQNQAERLNANSRLEARHAGQSCSQSQLCLALSILKSKPTDVTIREYCLQLRKHIKQGKPITEGEHRYIDTAEFWKDQYTKIHLEKKKLEDQLTQLEVRTEQNRTGGKAAMVELRSLSMAVDHQPKTSFSDVEFTNNLPLLKQALTLHRLLRDDKVSTDTLTLAIQSSLSYMNFAITKACETNSKEPDGTGPSANDTPLRTFDTVASIFNICLKGLAHLCRDIPGRRCKGQVIYSLVQFFVKTLGHLHNTCVRRTVYLAPNVGDHQDRAAHRAGYEDKSRTLALISGFTQFLVNILTCQELQEAHLSHMEVLEGMFSALLEEVGVLVSQVIFDEHLSTLREPVSVSDSDSSSALASMNSLAVDLKCRHLSIVLKRTIEGRSENDKYSLAAMLAGTKVLGIGAGKKLILARARQRLQETLLKGIFGDDGEEFMNALQTPESEEGWDSEAPQIEQDEKEAFVESVWFAVGWDTMLQV